MFDTHCHLQFSAFEGKVDEVIKEARDSGVEKIVVPGTDIETSQKAIEIAGRSDDVYAAAGIHPHHVYQIKNLPRAESKGEKLTIEKELGRIESLLKKNRVVAVGEIGLDRHTYQKTRYENYAVDEDLMTTQKEFFIGQLRLAKKYKKSVIIHNREAKEDTLAVLNQEWGHYLSGRTVFHCCEPDQDLLDFAQEHHVFIGVDGDVTYRKDKQEFVKKIPLDLLVLETDSPFLIPEPLRSQKVFPNKPANLVFVKDIIASLVRQPTDTVEAITNLNSQKLFQISC